MLQNPRSGGAVDALFKEGLSHHQAGRLDQARDCYEQMLASAPRNFDALHMLGVSHIQAGQLELAAELISRAIAIRGDVPTAYGNLANALNGLHRATEALTASDRAISLAPEFAQAHGNRAQALRQLGRLEDALASYERVVALAPTPVAHFNRAAILRDLGRLEAALEGCDRAIALKADYVEALRSRGIVLCELDRFQDAVESFDQILTARPDHAQAWCGRGLALRKLGRPAEALASHDQALSLQPGYAEALCSKVAPLRDLNRPAEALIAADQALALDPRYAQAHNVRGVCLYDLRRLDEAMASFDCAIALDPRNATAHSNRGLALYELRRLDEAMASYDAALALQPDLADAQHNQAMCRLMLGQPQAGWAQYEWRWRTDELRAERRDTGAPPWRGQTSLAGQTILLWAEQGLGDTLQFCRYVPDVAALGARVVLEVQPGLERLAARLGGVAQVVARGQPAPPHDVQIPLMSLPFALGLEPDGRQGAYLRPDPADVAAWNERLAGAGGMRVGLCWAGGARPGQFVAHNTDKRRSLRLMQFAPLGRIQGLTVYSLQKGPPAGELAELREGGWSGPDIIDLTAEFGDFADTAAFVANLDLVITCDTAVAHLAGGLGKPVWILNRFDGCWRWLADRSDSAWYPTARLFRQPVPGDWASVIAQVAHELSPRA